LLHQTPEDHFWRLHSEVPTQGWKDTETTNHLVGRYIGECVRIISDLMDKLEEDDIPGLLMLVDFEKAFESRMAFYWKKPFTFSKSTSINKPGISSSSNLSIKSEMILTHSPIYLPLKKPFCVWLVIFCKIGFSLFAMHEVANLKSTRSYIMSYSWIMTIPLFQNLVKQKYTLAKVKLLPYRNA
jgi:hypothetical protein